MEAIKPKPPVFLYGDWEIEALSEDLVRLTYKAVEPPVEMLWYADHDIELYELAYYLNLVDRTLERGELSICAEKTFYELVRQDGEWRLRARGAINYELVGLNLDQAIRIALLLVYAGAESPFSSDFCKAVQLMGLMPVLDSIREVRIDTPTLEVVVSWRGRNITFRPIRMKPGSELITIASMIEAGLADERDLEVEVPEEDIDEFEEFKASLLRGEIDEDDLEDLISTVELRRKLAELLVAKVPHESQVSVEEDCVIVENSYGTWEIDLEDGGLHLNDEYICVEPSRPDMVVLPGVGPLQLGRKSLKVVASLITALRPDDVRDASLRRQIEKYRMR